MFGAFIIVMIVGSGSDIRGEQKISIDKNSNASNDGKLIAKARSDPAAFATLYRRHYDPVFRYCMHRLFERQTAEDVTSSVFLRVVENFVDFKGTERQFRNWLYTIATNACNDHLRKTARRNTLLKTNYRPDSKTGSADTSAERLALLKQAVFSLKPKYQTIITLRFFENLKLTEIAEVLESGPGTVRSQLARALAKLRKNIAAASAGEMKNE